MRFYHAFYICAIVAGVSWVAPTLCEGGTPRAQGHTQTSPQHLGRNDGQAPSGQLYIRKTDDSETRRTPEEEAFAKAYPELYATPGVIVTFGAEWCGHCKPQKRIIARHQRKYNVLVYDYDEKRGKALAERWGVKKLPTTVIVEQGKVVKTFIGLTSWETIRRSAGKAVKDDKRSQTTIEIFPFIRVDVRDSRTIDRQR